MHMHRTSTLYIHVYSCPQLYSLLLSSVAGVQSQYCGAFAWAPAETDVLAHYNKKPILTTNDSLQPSQSRQWDVGD